LASNEGHGVHRPGVRARLRDKRIIENSASEGNDRGEGIRSVRIPDSDDAHGNSFSGSSRGVARGAGSVVLVEVEDDGSSEKSLEGGEGGGVVGVPRVSENIILYIS
jgi:hypothetical protein